MGNTGINGQHFMPGMGGIGGDIMPLMLLMMMNPGMFGGDNMFFLMLMMMMFSGGKVC